MKGASAMLRFLFGSVSVVAILAGGHLLAQAPPTRPPAPQQPGEARPVPFNVDAFLNDYDANKDGFLSREELPPELRWGFERMDTNKDGKLSREELVRGAGYLHPQRRPSDMVYALIEMSEDDKEALTEAQRAYDILRNLDKNKDGKIDPDELKAMRESLVKERVDYIFKSLDANKDGRISQTEARGPIRDHFAVIDRNRDGFIDREELLKAALENPPATAPAAPGAPPAPVRPRDR
jgi:Ca2+-binding EF-hand superfamily protein